MHKLKKLLQILTMKIAEDNRRQCHINTAMSVIVCLSAGIMLVMNIMRHATLMTITSLILVGGFAATGVIAGVFKNSKISSMIMALILTGVFTVFPISGGNEGFAVLWVLLIPLFSISLFGLRIGLIMNAYFTLLIIGLFYSPLSVHIADLYTDNFMKRFPVLFLADAATAQFLAISMEYYYRVTKLQVYTDDMTGAYNRKYFMEMLESSLGTRDDLCIAVIDVNGLKETNDGLGHAAGDEMICSVPGFAKKAFGDDVVIARTGGDEFAIITYGKPEDISKKAESMKKYAAKFKGRLIGEVFLSVGVACRLEFRELSPEALFQKADKFMYEDKSAYYRQKGHDRRRR
ncbi:diguanylate cyclase [Ruminococcus sp.]|uniref:GGDEF domain-containing protein n=1 Tax=Ruminococcus sp. TaxID=41978 RepID=UPI0025DA7A9C|nr:diguanylate cyclase [Ruminococcus sp.]MBQ8967830.1 diguanylate cyclase [Ruminococcus sp.]